MPRPRNPNRDRAAEIWHEHKGKITNRQMAEMLGESEKVVAVWKQRDNWSKVVQQTNESCTTNVIQRKAGAPKGNKNAVGNTGGPGGPVGNDKAVTHGFFRRIFPPDALPIVDDIMDMDPLDILWQNIVIQYTAIARAQQIMFVRDQQDETKVLKRVKESDITLENEWEYQHAWDKQANFLQAQSRAMSTLEGLISRYEELLPSSPKAEEHKLRIQKLQAEVARLKGDDGDYEDDGFMDALKAEAAEVWNDDNGDET